MSFIEKINAAREEIYEERAVRRGERALRKELNELTNKGMDAALNRRADRFDELKSLGLIDLIEEVTHSHVIVSRPVSPEDQKRTSQGAYSKFRRISDEDFKKMMEDTNKAMQWTITVSSPLLNDRGVWDTSLNILITKRETFGNPPETTTIFYHDPSKRLRISGRQATFWGPIPEGDEGKKILEDSLAKAFADPYIHKHKPKEVPPHSHFGPDQKLG